MLGRTAAVRADKLTTPPKPVTVAVQAQDKSQLNYAYQKATSTLSVQVVNKQTGAFIREIEFKGFHALTFSSHGYKGNYVDQSG